MRKEYYLFFGIVNLSALIGVWFTSTLHAQTKHESHAKYHRRTPKLPIFDEPMVNYMFGVREHAQKDVDPIKPPLKQTSEYTPKHTTTTSKTQDFPRVFEQHADPIKPPREQTPEYTPKHTTTPSKTQAFPRVFEQRDILVDDPPKIQQEANPPGKTQKILHQQQITAAIVERIAWESNGKTCEPEVTRLHKQARCGEWSTDINHDFCPIACPKVVSEVQGQCPGLAVHSSMENDGTCVRGDTSRVCMSVSSLSDVHIQYFSYDGLDFYSQKTPSVDERNLGFLSSFVSNCVGWRKDALQGLTNALTARKRLVHNYGNCMHDADESAVESTAVGRDARKNDIGKRHRYVFAFENSEKEGYTTEKLFYLLTAGAVPVYRGAPDVRKFLPSKDAAVVVDGSNSPEEIAAMLDQETDEMYHARLAWRNQVADIGWLSNMDLSVWHSTCRLCVHIRSMEIQPPTSGIWVRERGFLEFFRVDDHVWQKQTLAEILVEVSAAVESRLSEAERKTRPQGVGAVVRMYRAWDRQKCSLLSYHELQRVAHGSEIEVVMENPGWTRRKHIFEAGKRNKGEILLFHDFIGRLGNQLFQLASIDGIAQSNHATPCLRGDEYELIVKNFDGLNEPCKTPNEKTVKLSEGDQGNCGDPTFCNRAKYVDFKIKTSSTIKGYLQSFRYFSQTFQSRVHFKQSLKTKARQILEAVSKGKKTGIHVRRYEESTLNFPPAAYFETSMAFLASKANNMHFIITSDDPGWCKQQPYFQSPHVHIMSEQNSPFLDMAILAACDNIILSVGTFSWWAAYLRNEESGGYVIYYNNEINMQHPKNTGNVNLHDYYPDHWLPFNKIQSAYKADFYTRPVIHALIMFRIWPGDSFGMTQEHLLHWSHHLLHAGVSAIHYYDNCQDPSECLPDLCKNYNIPGTYERYKHRSHYEDQRTMVADAISKYAGQNIWFWQADVDEFPTLVDSDNDRNWMLQYFQRMIHEHPQASQFSMECVFFFGGPKASSSQSIPETYLYRAKHSEGKGVRVKSLFHSEMAHSSSVNPNHRQDMMKGNTVDLNPQEILFYHYWGNRKKLDLSKQVKDTKMAEHMRRILPQTKMTKGKLNRASFKIEDTTIGGFMQYYQNTSLMKAISGTAHLGRSNPAPVDTMQSLPENSFASLVLSENEGNHDRFDKGWSKYNKFTLANGEFLKLGSENIVHEWLYYKVAEMINFTSIFNSPRFLIECVSMEKFREKLQRAPPFHVPMYGMATRYVRAAEANAPKLWKQTEKCRDITVFGTIEVLILDYLMGNSDRPSNCHTGNGRVYPIDNDGVTLEMDLKEWNNHVQENILDVMMRSEREDVRRAISKRKLWTHEISEAKAKSVVEASKHVFRCDEKQQIHIAEILPAVIHRWQSLLNWLSKDHVKNNTESANVKT